MEDKLKEYETLKSDLKESLARKRKIEDEFDRLQQEIYDKETEYFTSSTYITAGSSKPLHIPGNIVKGFDGFSKSSSHSHSNQNDNSALKDTDRIFSLSSANYIKQTQNIDKYLAELHSKRNNIASDTEIIKNNDQ